MLKLQKGGGWYNMPSDIHLSKEELLKLEQPAAAQIFFLIL